MTKTESQQVTGVTVPPRRTECTTLSSITMKIIELTLLTNDLPETKRFYGQTMGFKIDHETETDISFGVGTSKLIFQQVLETLKPKYHLAFNIPSNQLEEAIQWTLERTGLIETEGSPIADFDHWNAKAIYFYDNQMNVLEFIVRNDLNNPSNEVFSVDSILNINEIGIVADQPLQFAHEIIEKTGTQYFPKGPKRADFVAIGDETGLLVVSGPNRNWYPTNDSAEKWKVQAIIKMADQEFELEWNGESG